MKLWIDFLGLFCLTMFNHIGTCFFLISFFYLWPCLTWFWQFLRSWLTALIHVLFSIPVSNFWPPLTMFKHDFAMVKYGLTCSLTMVNHGWSLLTSEQFDLVWRWSSLVPFNVYSWPWSNHGYITTKPWLETMFNHGKTMADYGLSMVLSPGSPFIP